MHPTCAKNSFLAPRNKEPKKSFYTNMPIKLMNIITYFFPVIVNAVDRLEEALPLLISLL